MVELAELFGDLGSGAGRVRPVEADAVHFLADALCARERRKALGYALEERPMPFFFLRFYSLPVAQHVRRILDFRVTEHMRMATYQLAADTRDHVVGAEQPFGASQLRLKHDLKKQVAQLLAQPVLVVLVDGIDDFAGLFEHIATQ